MKVKVYKVWINDEWYLVDAPNRHIAKWCAANLYNHDHIAFKAAKDVEKIKRFGYKEN